MIIRSHEVRQEGYTVEHGGKLVCCEKKIYFLFLIFYFLQITLFSAPNYMQEQNKGAYLRLCGADIGVTV
jgi:hypothetical protein